MIMPSFARFDVIVIGAGFSGLYALHRLRELGVRARVLEMAENVGGTWLFNRYPVARCDIESIEYSYSFSDEIQQEWVWTETMPAQPEIEAYLNFVADRLDLRRDISFNTEVVGMTFDEDAGEWLVETWAGECFVAPFVVAASGILSVPLEPEIPGMDTFAGPSLYTSCWPKEGVDLTGKRVGVIGTGSTGVQLIPVVARQAGHLSVFQRSPAYTLPWQVRPFEPGELDEMKSRYCPTPSVSGSSTRPRWSRRPSSSTRPATPGTTGANVPGKKRMYMGYTAGIPEYRRRCDEIAAAGYTGFKLA